MHYQYDAENQRIAVDQTQYVINSQPVLSQVLVKTDNGQSTYYVYGLGLIGEESARNYVAYHYDFRGSTVALTDKNGQVIENIHYSPFGELLTQPTHNTPFLFNGMYGVMTGANGLNYMRARYYSADIRRFVNQDVLLGNIADGQSLNRFAFVTGNPVSFVDPFGLEKVEVIIRGDQWYRHAEVIIGGKSYSNGRYLDKDEDSIAISGGTVGSNILKEKSANESRWEARKKSWLSIGLELNLTTEEVQSLKKFYDDLIENSSAVEGKPNRYHDIGIYLFTGNNCATLVAEGLMSALPWYKDFLLKSRYINPFFDPTTLHILLEFSPGVVDKTNTYQYGKPSTISDEAWLMWMRR